jgi:4-hydroxy-tetrahydrodipicolinate synthase
MKSNPYKGVGTALITPFKRDASLDLGAFSAHVERQIAGGVDFLIPCGTTGEAVTLDLDEYEKVIATTVEVAAHRVNIVAGAGSNSTDKTIELAAIAKNCGADAVLVVTPYYNKPTPEGCYQHFKAVAEAVPLPMIIYNVPGRTSVNMSAATQLRIAGIDGVVATKEASGNLSQQMEIVAAAPTGFHVLSGDDALALPQIAIGMMGVISVVANETPKEFSDMIHAAMSGDFASARDMHYRLLDLMETNFIESSPIPVKAALAMMGCIEEVYRLPLVRMQDANKAKLRDVLKKLNLVS